MHPRSQRQNPSISVYYSELPRKMDTGPNAVSRYPIAATVEHNPEMPFPGTTSKAVDVLDVIRQHGSPVEEEASDEHDSIVYAIIINILEHLSVLNDNSVITTDQVNDTCRSDRTCQKLVKSITNGFPKTRGITDREIRNTGKSVIDSHYSGALCYWMTELLYLMH